MLSNIKCVKLLITDIVKLFLTFLSFTTASRIHRALFTNFLTPGLTREFCNPLDDWLDWLIPTNHQAGYLIRKLTPGWSLSLLLPVFGNHCFCSEKFYKNVAQLKKSMLFCKKEKEKEKRKKKRKKAV